LFKLLKNPWARKGIAAEILFYRGAIKKIGAESPVFFAACRKKNAPISFEKGSNRDVTQALR
jgi:hypothetical protein